MTTTQYELHQNPPYQDPQRPIEERVEDLLGRMTLEEKAGMMFQTMVMISPDGEFDLDMGAFGLASIREMTDKHMTHFNLVGSASAEKIAKWVNQLQKLAASKRLGIPITLSTDPRHNFAENPGVHMATRAFSQWPESPGLAAIGDETLVEEFADIARQEYIAVGLRSALHPVADLATEPRWARVNGTFGEDNQLAARLTAAYIRGFQGKELGPHSVACMTKHFPGGGPQLDGEDPHFDYGREQVYPGNHFDYHLLPFEAAFSAGTAMMMPYYGMPIGTDYEPVGFSFNHGIITGLLREQYGFDGVVCTDWGLLTDANLGGMIFPARENVTDDEHIDEALDDIEQELEDQIRYFKQEDKLVEAQRIEQRTRYDIEMLREVGFTTGIENYSRHFDRRPPGSAPFTLIDYLPSDHLLVIDESHMTVPQIRGMYKGDRQRKQTLVDYGFRLPSALDNRPLKFEEFEGRVGQTIYTSATPGPYEHAHSEQVVDQIIRPTGIVDPQVDVRPIEGQIDDLLQEIALRVKRGQRALVTTLTQRMAEELAGYLNELGIKGQYLHARVDTLERVEILRDLREGVYDVVVGINLLREGLDLPEVSLVAILDADKAGFLRSEQALIQTIGRAARHIEGSVIMYADKMTPAMEEAIGETNRRRDIQEAFNRAHGIEPQQIVKDIQDINDRLRSLDADAPKTTDGVGLAALPADELQRMIAELEREMRKAAQELEFEKAAALRDQVFDLRGALAERQGIETDSLVY